MVRLQLITMITIWSVKASGQGAGSRGRGWVGRGAAVGDEPRGASGARGRRETKPGSGERREGAARGEWAGCFNAGLRQREAG
ncbi:MAG: hypothetical protein CME85_12595 [Henriciella sp.]|nr:hypothetical protein [Henriciella sp.]MBF33582.1 hypothetical protein [Hyphomonadaceae bacterium]MBK76311.1 hypothetical protein [Henriciella sp.]